MEGDNLRRLFEHAACVGGDFCCPIFPNSRRKKATALQLACMNKNSAAVNAILQANTCLSGDGTVEILFNETEHEKSPVCIAVDECCFEIVESLLEFEKCHSGMTSDGSCISKQWSIDVGSRLALHKAIRNFDEDQMLHLLGIARPENINIRDPKGLTVLHQAAKYGRLRLARELVEKNDADLGAKSRQGWTPPFVAFVYEHDKLLEYFQSRGANVDFNEEDRTRARRQLLRRIRKRIN